MKASGLSTHFYPQRNVNLDCSFSVESVDGGVSSRKKPSSHKKDLNETGVEIQYWRGVSRSPLASDRIELTSADVPLEVTSVALVREADTIQFIRPRLNGTGRCRKFPISQLSDYML